MVEATAILIAIILVSSVCIFVIKVLSCGERKVDASEVGALRIEP